MRIALAQIDARLGDIEGVCERLESQAAVAREQGADLICIPSPLLTGIVPGALIESANFEHDLVSELSALAGRLAELGIMALIPAVVAFDRAPLFEVFLLKKGRVVPLRPLWRTVARRPRTTPGLPPSSTSRGRASRSRSTPCATSTPCPPAATS